MLSATFCDPISKSHLIQITFDYWDHFGIAQTDHIKKLILYLKVVDVVVVIVVEDPDAVEAAGWGTVVEVVLAQVGCVINQSGKKHNNKMRMMQGSKILSVSLRS